MDDNKMPNQELTAKQKQQQAGKDVAEVAAKAAGAYFGGTAGAQAVDTISKTKVGQHALNKLGNQVANSPGGKTFLKDERIQNAIHKAKPMADQAIGAMSGNPDAANVTSTAANSASATSSQTQGGSTLKMGSKSPFKFLNNSSSNSSSNEESTSGEESSASGEVIHMMKKLFKPMMGVFGGFGGCLSAIVIVLIAAIMISPLLYISDLTESTSKFGERLGNFLIFRGWCTDEECAEMEKNNFYEYVDEIYNHYKENYNVELNTPLIVATLTYNNPFIDNLENEDISFDYDEGLELQETDYKKSKKMVKKLAQNMVERTEEEIITCYLISTNEIVDCDIETEQEIKVVKDIIVTYALDEEKYKQYLEDNFIKNFYFNDYKGEDIDKKISQTIEEIYARVKFYAYLTGSENSSDNLTINNTIVRLLNCNTGALIEEVTLYEYLQGILYYEGFATNRSEEFLKVMAVVAKNYLYAINGATTDSIPNVLSVRNCSMNQNYCSVSEGCHIINDSTVSKDDGSINTNYNTIVTGADSEGNYKRGPLTDIETLEKIKNAIDSTFNEFIVNGNKFVTTQYRSSCSGICDSTNNIMDQKVANQMVESGSTYKEVLAHFYTGEIQEITLYIAGYPLDLEYNNVTSAYGWREHPVYSCCGHHNGTDIGAKADANIYSIADGVVVTNDFNNSYGNYTVIGHGNYNEETGNYEYYSLYAHQIRLSSLVKENQSVKAGQKIGNVGSTGTSTGNHLHIEIYTYSSNNKVRQDPVEYFDNVELRGMVGLPLYESLNQCMSYTGLGKCQ